MLSNADLVASASRKDAFLRGEGQRYGVTVQQAVATTLVEMHAEMGRRIEAAAGKRLPVGTPPAPVGTHWSSESLAGIPEGISPFHMIEWWGSYLVTEKSGRAAGTRTTRTRRGAGARTPGVGVPPNTSSTPGGRRDRLTPPRSPRGARSELGKAVGKPKKIGIDNEKWWRNIGSGPAKAVYQMATNWINALRAGVQKSMRRFLKRIVADGIASMAVKIPDDSIWIVGRDPILGRPVYGYGLIPEPDDTLVARRIVQEIKQWASPSDWIALELARQGGLKIARDYVHTLDRKTSGGGVRYLLYLKTKFKANRLAIYRHVHQELSSQVTD